MRERIGGRMPPIQLSCTLPLTRSKSPAFNRPAMVAAQSGSTGRFFFFRSGSSLMIPRAVLRRNSHSGNMDWSMSSRDCMCASSMAWTAGVYRSSMVNRPRPESRAGSSRYGMLVSSIMRRTISTMSVLASMSSVNASPVSVPASGIIPRAARMAACSAFSTVSFRGFFSRLWLMIAVARFASVM